MKIHIWEKTAWEKCYIYWIPANLLNSNPEASQKNPELLLLGFVWAGMSLSYCVCYLIGDKYLDLRWSKKARKSWALGHFDVHCSSYTFTFASNRETSCDNNLCVIIWSFPSCYFSFHHLLERDSKLLKQNQLLYEKNLRYTFGKNFCRSFITLKMQGLQFHKG